MNQLFAGMDTLLQSFWWVALISSLIFVVQMIMTFAGGGHTDGVSADFEGDLGHAEAPFQMFTLRNLINFMLGFGWTGIAFFNVIESKGLLILLAVLVGIGFVALFFLIIRQILKLTEVNNFDIHYFHNKTGEVYLSIPGNMTGRGKVQISFKGSMHEVDAMTEGVQLPSGSLVRVDRVEQNMLIVNKIS